MIWILESLLIGFVAALLGVLYRNSMKGKSMVLNYWFFLVLQEMGTSKRMILRILSWPIGYSTTCTTFCITFIIYTLYYGWPASDNWKLWTIGLIAAEGLQHLTLLIISKHLLSRSTRFNPEIWTKKSDDDDETLEYKEADDTEDTNRPAIVRGFYHKEETESTN